MSRSRSRAPHHLTTTPLVGDGVGAGDAGAGGHGGAAGPAALDVDTEIQALAARQHGVVARWQLTRAGVAAHRIEHRLERGRFERIHQGIYRVGPVASPRYREVAALLACGPGAVLSHQSAGALWELHPPLPDAVPVAVSATGNVRGPGSGVRVYRVVGLGTDEIAQREGLPLTTPARTLLDLAGTLSTRQLEQALAQADRQHRLDRAQLELLLARYPLRRGRGRLRALLADETGLAFTRSEAEERFLALVRRAKLRSPEMNVHVLGFEVDALWRAERLVAEIDGHAFHSSKRDFERDRYRDGALLAAGFSVMRVTWQLLTQEPEVLLVRLAQALADRGTP